MSKRLKDIVDNCYIGGQNNITSFRKVPAIGSVKGSFVDFSMAPGNPRPNYYTGAELTATAFNSTYGLWHGGDVSPKTKILKSITGLSVSSSIVPMRLLVLDYLMFYPLINMDNTDTQLLINYGETLTATTDPTAAKLTRYTNGENVRAFLVATNPYIGGAQFSITYTNHLGVSNKITRMISTNTNTFIGTIVHSGTGSGLSGSFIDTPNNDGIRSIESITFLSPNGGLAALVLCKVLTETFIRETTTPSEWDFLLMKGELPIIKDGAYLNYIAQVNGSVSGQVFTGLIETIYD